MKIVEIREKTFPIASPIRNAYIDFTKMTLILVAVVTDVVRDGRRVVGYGFNSNGRYGQGALMRERFIPRVMEADPATLARRRAATTSTRTGSGRACSPTRSPAATASARSRSAPSTWRCGTRWRRSRASRSSPARERYGDGKAEPARVRLRRGRLLLPGQGRRRADARDARLPRARLQRGEDEDRRRAARRGPPPHRGGARASCGPGAPRRGRQRPLRPRHRDRLRQGAVATTTSSGTRRRATRSTTSCRRRSREHYAKPMATGENLFSMQDARNLIRYGGMRPDRDWLQFDCALSLRPGRVPAHARRCCASTAGRPRAASRTAATRCRSTSRPAWASAATSRYPDLFQPFGGFPDGVRVEDGHVTMPELPGIGFEGKSDLYKVMRELAA